MSYPSSVSAVEAALLLAQARPDIMTSVSAERARRVAMASDARRQTSRLLGPLDGVPAVIKDVFDLKERPAHAGGLEAYSAGAEVDAGIVGALERAGCCILGTTNMSELAFSGLGINPHYGTPPIQSLSGEVHAPGGSSSGAAAALAAGIATVSIGTDTSGSVRIPACFHGIVGFKASAGRYPGSGMVPLAPSLDSIGVLAADVETAIQVDIALAVDSPPAPSNSPQPVLVMPESIVMQDLEPAVEQHFRAALERLGRAGFMVEMGIVPQIDTILQEQQRVGTLVGMEAWRQHRAHLVAHADHMDHRVVTRLRQAGSASEPDYQGLLATRQQLAASSQSAFSGRMLVMPSVACTSPLLRPLLQDDDAFFATNRRVLRNTMVANLLDWCAISLPLARNERGLWSGFMLCAGRGQDRALLETARLLAPLILN